MCERLFWVSGAFALIPNWLLKLGKKQPPPDEESGTIHIYASDASVSVVMITVLGVQPSHIDEIIAVAKAKFSVRHRLVFLTDSLDFMQFRRQGVMFEYLPTRHEQQRHAEVMPWDSYLKGRWDLLLAKWKPLHVLAYGQNIDTYLAAVSGNVAEAGTGER